MSNQPKFDEAPEQAFIDLMNEKFKESDAYKSVSMANWGKDKSIDFYLGMMTAIGVSCQAVEAVIATGAPVEALFSELHLFNGQLSTIVKEKESKIILV